MDTATLVPAFAREATTVDRTSSYSAVISTGIERGAVGERLGLRRIVIATADSFVVKGFAFDDRKKIAPRKAITTNKFFLVFILMCFRFLVNNVLKLQRNKDL